MNVTIKDRNTYLSLKPSDTALYLRSRSWVEVEDVPGRASVWISVENGNDQVYEILLPLNPQFKDYAIRMSELVQTLSIAEDRSQLEIVKDICSTSADLIRVRAKSRTLADGSIQIDDGAAFVNNSRDMLMAAACSSVKPKPLYQGRRPGLVDSYMENVRLGQTEHGRYVVTLISKIPPALSTEHGLFDQEIEEPFGRQVTHTLIKSLSALKTAVDRAITKSSMSGFEEALEKGVSANLCDAVVGLGRLGDIDSIGIDVSYSPARPPQNVSVPRIEFFKDSVEIIEEASRYFKAISPLDDFQLLGHVTKLEDVTDVDSTRKVTISSLIDGKPRKLIVTTNDHNSFYHMARKAFDERLTIECVGDLRKDGKSFLLDNPRHFALVNDEQDNLTLFETTDKV